MVNLVFPITENRSNIMSQTRRGKTPVVNVPAPIMSPNDILEKYMNLFNGRDHCPRYDEIYKIFNTGETSHLKMKTGSLSETSRKVVFIS
jgi:hypothetical protein